MTLHVIGAGLGRTGTLSLKLAMEHLGLGRCYHAMELAATLRRSLPLWNEAIDGRPNWEALFAGYTATTDYPGCCFWQELAAHYPQAKVILTTRDPDDWFDSVHATIFAKGNRHPSLFGAEGQRLSQFMRREMGERIGEREYMTNYFKRWNQRVIDQLPADRLLLLRAEEGWDRLCAFLDVPVPATPYPRVHARDGGSGKAAALPAEPALLEQRIRAYLDRLQTTAFSSH